VRVVRCFPMNRMHTMQSPSSTQLCRLGHSSPGRRERVLSAAKRVRMRLISAGLASVFAAAIPAIAAETPKFGGTLTYMIPADAPPSFDGHREPTYATVHSAAPFYSTLVWINPEDPSSATDFVCDLCTQLPKPTSDGKTYTFEIRDGVKFHDGSPLTTADVAASWNAIIHPPEGVTSAREAYFVMVDAVDAPDPTTVVFHLKFATDAFLPALADPFAWI
jgi:peptide/nickel transport system substrate-binding protein